MTQTVRIATRKSPLAVWQAEHVGRALRRIHPGLQVELVHMSTRGDVILDSPLSRIGGKGLFVKELEKGILEGRADIAVHSMKDVPAQFPQGLHLTAILEREDPRDAFVSAPFASPDELPQGARVGTCSLRRRCQLLERRPDLQILDLRGNVNTRLRKLDNGEFEAIVLAAAGLKRLGMGERIRQHLDTQVSLPAIGQGAIGVECRSGDPQINALVAPLNEADTACRVMAERAFNARMGGSCQVPIAGYAELHGETLHLRALVGRPDGTLVVRGEARAPASEAAALGLAVAENILGRGGREVLDELFEHDVPT